MVFLYAVPLGFLSWWGEPLQIVVIYRWWNMMFLLNYTSGKLPIREKLYVRLGFINWYSIRRNSTGQAQQFNSATSMCLWLGLSSIPNSAMLSCVLTIVRYFKSFMMQYCNCSTVLICFGESSWYQSGPISFINLLCAFDAINKIMK